MGRYSGSSKTKWKVFGVILLIFGVILFWYPDPFLGIFEIPGTFGLIIHYVVCILIFGNGYYLAKNGEFIFLQHFAFPIGLLVAFVNWLVGSAAYAFIKNI
ncbi:MAG: hypothetical protein LBM41_05790 [Ruminococcus sp.]|jgi:hypothetical protein|nr:hypothetical protein [Ruminococcus sp.]